MTAEERASQFYKEFFGLQPSGLQRIAQSGSSRQNFIAESGAKKSVITFNDNLRENEAFLYFSEVFSTLNLNTPKIFKISDDRKWYIQEYLGGKTLSEIIENEGLSENVKSLVRQSLERLFEFQRETEGRIDFAKTFEYESYGELAILHDLNYFKFMFVDVLGISYHKSALLQEFKKIANIVEKLQPKVLMIRDFQARNIIVNAEKNVFFIDYQSAMEGPAMYDAVSFLYQAKADFPENFRREMLVFFISKFPEELRAKLFESVNYILLMRYLQVLGAYGFRGLVQRKPHFMASIEKGVQNLVNFAKNWGEMKDYPNLLVLINELSSVDISLKINNLNR